MVSKSLLEARDRVLCGEELSADLKRLVRPAVLRSWHRSLMSGVDPGRPVLVFHGDAHARHALRRAADPILSVLAEHLSGLEAGVLLADHEANIVRRWAPDSSMRAMLDGICSDAGFRIREEDIGTNGVGSVIEHGGPLQIAGPEHLAGALTPFTCVGAPIRHPVTRRLEGIVTLSCRASATNPLLNPLMTRTAQDIEQQLLEQASADERHLLDEYVMALGARGAPVVAVGQHLLIAGPKVEETLGGIDRALLWEYIRAVALGDRADASKFGIPPERLHIARCRPVEHGGKIIGAIVELDVAHPEPRRARRTRSKPSHPTVVLPGKSAALVMTVSRATRLISSGASVLIEGEPGVGKTTLARALLNSSRSVKSQIAGLDAACHASPGADPFIGALRNELDRRPEVLLLRHLECLTLDTAAASAALLENALASDTPPQVVSTLTESPGARVDLVPLRRLIDTVGVGRVAVLPLRDRREDIAPAAVALLEKHRRDKPLWFSAAAVRCLVRAPWPGNLRQLDATVRSLVSTEPGGEIRAESLPVELQSRAQKRQLSAIEEVELDTILAALQQHGGNKLAAARSIGISRSTLYRKLSSYHIDPDKQYF